MSDILSKAISCCNKSSFSFCKFISANDSGETGGHQAGFYIPKNSYLLLFNSEGVNGENKDKNVKIKWQDDIETDSRFIYYGRGTRDEYRITRFGRGFPYLNTESTGNLFILCKEDDNYYNAFILEEDIEIDRFLSTFGMTPVDTNRLIEVNPINKELKSHVLDFIKEYGDKFPSTRELSELARSLYLVSKEISLEFLKKEVVDKPDSGVIGFIDLEFRIFKMIEQAFYTSYIEYPLFSVDRLVEVANKVLNRRKSRAGKALENHLEYIFSVNQLSFTAQAKTEGNKKPDFIFPDINYYFDDSHLNNLTFLAAKTTCKDRWRQILNEANRIPNKHLFTLQQGISSNQLKEMKNHNVTLVVPQQYLGCFPREHREDILTLKRFIFETKARSS